jgi:hypothetical protein
LYELARATASRRTALIAACVAGLVFLGAWATLHHGFYTKHQIIDTPIYQRYGDWMLQGHIPYRDFAVEYPPGALPAFALPAIGNEHSRTANPYRRNFEVLMALCGLAAIALVAATLLSMEASNAHLLAALALFALFPLLLGSVVSTRFDLWPAMITIASLTALLADRRWLGFGLLGAATAVKIFPVVLLPLACIWVWKRAGRRELLASLQMFFTVLVVIFLPFLIVGPDGVGHSLARQLGRPLQIESLGASILIGLHDLIGFGLVMKSGSGSQNLSGLAPQVLAAAQSLLQLTAVVGIAVWLARGEANRERLVRASAAAIAAFVAFGKVLSPQFLIWLVPVVPLVRGRRGLLTSGLLALSLVVTQLWFPYRYFDYANLFAAFPTALVIVRNLVLIGLLAALLAPAPQTEAEPEPEPPLPVQAPA